MKKRIIETILSGISFILAFILIIILMYISYIHGRKTETEYWTKLNTHVINIWSNPETANGHECPYDESWCSYEYYKFLKGEK